jgi:hypothetical protein
MDKYLKLSFCDSRGVTCGRCMLSFTKGERSHCAALGNRPFCPEDGCRRDCPLKSMEEVSDATNK